MKRTVKPVVNPLGRAHVKNQTHPYSSGIPQGREITKPWQDSMDRSRHKHVEKDVVVPAWINPDFSYPYDQQVASYLETPSVTFLSSL